MTGRTEEARKQLVALRELAKRQFVPAFHVALLYTGLGEKDHAFAWLDRAYEERSGYLMVNSLLPKAARAAGIPFGELLDRLVRLALEEEP